MKYMIELDNDEGWGVVTLIDGIICVTDDIGNIQSTGVHSTLDTLDRDIHAMYGSTVWDLQLED